MAFVVSVFRSMSQSLPVAMRECVHALPIMYSFGGCQLAKTDGLKPLMPESVVVAVT